MRPHGRHGARNLLWAGGKLAGYGIAPGLEPVQRVLLHPAVIERFTAPAPGATCTAATTTAAQSTSSPAPPKTTRG